MTVSNGTDDTTSNNSSTDNTITITITNTTDITAATTPTTTTSNDNTDSKPLTSSPPSTPPSSDNVDAHPLEEQLTSSSPDRRIEIDEQPIIISQDFLRNVLSMVESLGPRRVKVYELRGEVWVDLGTGFCQGFVENVIFLHLPRKHFTDFLSRALHI